MTKLILAAFGCLIIWASSPFINELYALLFDLEINAKLDSAGKFGDSFGVATSLFSFASFISALYILKNTHTFQQMKDRPYLATYKAENSTNFKITATSKDSLTIEIRINIKNYSDYLAHSINIKPTIHFKKECITGEPVSIPRPVNSSEQEIPIIYIYINTIRNRSFLDEISSNGDIELNMDITYKNTTGKSFKSINTYKIIPPEIHEPINAIRRGEFNTATWDRFFVACEIKEKSDFIQDITN